MKLYALLSVLALAAGSVQGQSDSLRTQTSMPAFLQTSQSNDQDSSPKKGKATDSEAFSEVEANAIMSSIHDGLVGHDSAKLLSAFDNTKMEGYQGFRAQVVAMFDHFEAFRVHFHITEVTADGTKGGFSADLELEKSPRANEGLPVRKRESVHFEVEQGSKGWKIVDLQPRSFFS
jgi:hypothetical protein